MPGVKITDLPLSTNPPNTTDVLPIVQGGVTSQTTLGALFTQLAGVTQSGTGAVSESAQTALRRTVFASQYDTVAHAITAAGTNGELIFSPNTTYEIPAALTQLTGQKWKGSGGQRSATLKKIFNGDLVTMGDLGEISDLNFDGNGATYTGKNIVVSGSSQKISRIRSTASAGIGIAVTSSGGGLQISQVEADTTSPTSVAAISLTGATASNPKFLTDIWLSGGFLDISGADDVFINGGYAHHIATSSTTANYYITNFRYALSSDPLTISGAGGQYSSCAFAGAITLADTSGIVFDPSCEFGSGVSETAATCLFNSFHVQSTAYTPTWDQASGTQPALGNGTITGRYIRQGRTCKLQMLLTLGTTSTTGNNAVGYRFSLPFNSHNAFNQNLIGRAKVWDASTGTNYYVDVQITSNVAVMTLTDTNAAIRDGYPIAWASSDRIYIECEYSTL